MEILGSYSEHGLNMGEAKIELPDKEIDIKLSKEIADRLNPIAMKIGEQFELYGIRAKINFKCLLKCLAYRDNNKTVGEAEFSEFMELSNFMNFRYNPI